MTVGPDPAVYDQLEAIFAGAGCDGFLHVCDIDGDGEVAFGADELGVSGSVFKVSVALELHRQAAVGEIDPAERVQRRAAGRRRPGLMPTAGLPISNTVGQLAGGRDGWSRLRTVTRPYNDRGARRDGGAAAGDRLQLGIVHLPEVSSSGFKHLNGEATYAWHFTPTCAAGPCKVRWSDDGLHAVATRSGTSYTFTASGFMGVTCGGAHTSSTATVHLQVMRAQAIGGRWKAFLFHGTLDVETSPQLGCVASSNVQSLTGDFVS